MSLRIPALILAGLAGATGCVVPGDATPFAPVDAAAPFVEDTIPAPGATEVPQDVTVDLFFSEAMAWEAVSEDLFRLESGHFPAPFTLDRSGTRQRRLSVVPTEPLAPNLEYTLTVRGEIMDRRHNPMGEDYVLTFTVAENPPAFEVVATDPADGATEVPLETRVEVTFSAPPAARLVDARSFSVDGLSRREYVLEHDPGSPVVVIAPTVSLEPETTYTVTLSEDLKSTSGQRLTGPVTFGFTTAQAH